MRQQGGHSCCATSGRPGRRVHAPQRGGWRRIFALDVRKGPSYFTAVPSLADRILTSERKQIRSIYHQLFSGFSPSRTQVSFRQVVTFPHSVIFLVKRVAQKTCRFSAGRFFVKFP